jgi:hypothetical protein
MACGRLILELFFVVGAVLVALVYKNLAIIPMYK